LKITHKKDDTQNKHGEVRMNLILIKSSEILEKSGFKQVILNKNDDRTVHILKHLRKKSGETISVGIIGGQKGKASVQISDNSMTLCLDGDTFVEAPSEPEITIIIALPFPARLKALWPVVASFTAVTRIIIIKGKLSNEEFRETSALQPKVYEPLIEKGMSQGVRTRPVQVDICVEGCVSKELLQKLGVVNDCLRQNDGVARLFLDCGDESTIPLTAREVVLKNCKEPCDSSDKIAKAVLAFGPERGWTDDEANIFVHECDFESATLGSSILRVDTAVIAGIGIVSAALDECTNNDITGSNKKRKT
jgi:RsmE family RNA methyltransferase